MNLLGIIPARGGSKGIPGKNISDVCGRPLMDYTISVCLKSGVFSRLIVSTDSSRIAKIAQKCGAEAPFLRPKEFASDTASPQHAIEYTKKRLAAEGYEADALAVLFPTHPFRNVSMLRTLASKISDYHFIQTVLPIKVSKITYLIEQQGRLEPLLAQDETLIDQGVHHIPAGSFYGVNFQRYEKEYYFHQLTDPIEQIDIDTQEDLEVTRAIISNELYDFDA